MDLTTDSLRESGQSRDSADSSAWIAGAVVLLASGFFASFLSQHYIGDGVRWLPMITQSVGPPVDMVRHPLFPTLGWVWHHLGQGLGYDGNPVSWLQLMNALAGGLGAGLYFCLLQHLTQDRFLSLVGCLLLSFSNAYSSHATDMTEVMASFLFTMVSCLFAVKSAERGSVRWAVAGALAISLATALFISSILVVPAVVILIWGVTRRGGTTGMRAHLKTPIVFAVMTLLLTPLIFILVFRFSHTDSLLGAVRFILAEPQRVALGVMQPGFKVVHFGGTVFGWAGAILGLQKFFGVRLLLAHLDSWEAWWNLLTVGFLISMVGVFLFLLWRKLRTSFQPAWPWLFGSLWFVPGVLLAWYVEPPHTKLWVHPLAGFFFLIAWGLVQIRRARESERAIRIWLAVFLAVVIGVNVFVNLAPRRFTPSPYLADAQYLAKLVGENDLLVSESFDPVSVYYSTVFLRKRNFFSFLVNAVELEFDNTALRDLLALSVQNHLDRGGRIYFLGLFDAPLPQGWEKTLGGKKGVDYGIVEVYREQSQPVLEITSLSKEVGRPIWLWEYAGRNKVNAALGT